MSVLLGNGDGTFQAAVSFAAGEWTPISVAVADLDGDTVPDLVTANNTRSDDVSVLLGNGDGTFQAAVSFAAGDVPQPPSPWPTSMATPSPTSLPPILFSDDVSVLLGNGDGTFQAAVSFFASGDAAYDPSPWPTSMATPCPTS